MINAFTELLKEQLTKEMGKEKFSRFEAATEHPYECKCDICIEWWEEMGDEE